MPPRFSRRRERLADSIGSACRVVLLTADPAAKVRAGRAAWRDWRLGRLDFRFDQPMPGRPARPERPLLLMPRDMPRRRSAGSPRARLALLHALAHIEFAAIDLAFDMVGRFGGEMPRAFTDDWMRVGAEEAMHFALLDRRLRGLGSHYGALPAHDGLWEAAEATAHDLAARLAVVPLVLEARGLDVTPGTIDRLTGVGDDRSATILRRILADEVNHVAAGVRWFDHVTRNRGCNPLLTFQTLVESHFCGRVKPPFNDSARDEAGLPREFYMALARKDVVSTHM